MFKKTVGVVGTGAIGVQAREGEEEGGGLRAPAAATPRLPLPLSLS